MKYVAFLSVIKFDLVFKLTKIIFTIIIVKVQCYAVTNMSTHYYSVWLDHSFTFFSSPEMYFIFNLCVTWFHMFAFATLHLRLNCNAVNIWRCASMFLQRKVQHKPLVGVGIRTPKRIEVAFKCMQPRGCRAITIYWK